MIGQSACHLNCKDLCCQCFLFYIFYIGNVIGSGDLLKWFETSTPSVTVENVDSAKEYHLIITAINKSGCFKTESFRIV